MNKALLVGINNYPNCPLRGCVNDVTDMANLLVTGFGFKPEEIRLLTDARATTDAIIERLTWLADAKPGDKVFFHYSGHGAQYPARNDKSEIDGKYEIICPVDFDWSPRRMITDKQFVNIFKRMPSGVKFNWFSDSCHSGDLDRNMTPKMKKGTIINGMRRYPVPADIAWRQYVAKEKKIIIEDRGLVNGTLEVGFVSGCRSDQTSADAAFGGKANGALTYFLIKHLSSNKSLPLNAIVPKVIGDMKNYGFTQVPTCAGTRGSISFLG